MKKIYMQPLTEVVKINIEQMICQSLEVKALDISDPGSQGFTPADKEDNQFFDPNLW